MKLAPFFFLLACAAPPPLAAPTKSAAVIELVESWPLDTTLDHPGIRDAKDVWLELIQHASKSLDFAEFYASTAPKESATNVLEPIIQAIEAAADRGVKVRWLAEEIFYKTYPETLDRLAKRPNVEVRRFDVKHVMGGILHAKYFIVDREQLYVGSQNFDWRSLEHIQELGVRTSAAPAVRALSDIFDTDWALAAGGAKEARVTSAQYGFPLQLGDHLGALTLTADPKGFLPDESLWDLPAIIKRIDAAKKIVRVQLLTYGVKGHGEDFPDLEAALQRAAARGVHVEFLASDWCTRKGTIDSLRRLHAPPGIEVKIITIPPWSGGNVPFGRVAHAKYMIVDDAVAWIGTSNWERGYFYQSRNIGIILDGGTLPAVLAHFFDDNWQGTYVAPFDPTREY